MFRYEAYFTLFVALAPAVIGLLTAIFFPTAIHNPPHVQWAALSAYGTGFGMILLAKGSLFRRGRRVSVGSEGMTAPYRCIYRAGYCLMAVGFVLTVMLIAANQGAR